MSYQTQGFQQNLFDRNQGRGDGPRGNAPRSNEGYSQPPPSQQQFPSHVTPIDLLDLDEVADNNYTRGGSQVELPDMGKYAKHIRQNNYSLPAAAGMTPQTHSIPSFQDNLDDPPELEQRMMPQAVLTSQPRETPSCIEIAEHIGSCPICSKFYKRDSTVYIIAIVILAIICILLLKKTLDI